MKVFEFCVDLKEGYAPVPITETEEETEVRFTIEAKNRATAARAVKALLKGATNVQGYTGFYVGVALSYVDYKSEKERKRKNERNATRNI